MARALWRSVLLSLLLHSASGFLAPRPRSGSSGRAGRTALASSDPLLSLPIPGSARARLEVPGWDAQRQLLRELVDEAQRVSPAAALRRSARASGAVAGTVARVAANPFSASAPRVTRELFEELGATFVKLGQLIASSPTLFPEAWISEFEKTLDDAPPVAFAEIRRIVERELGEPLATAFASFDEAPLATASVAQVHAATLATGERVVVKVLKPGVSDTLTADLAFMTSVAKVLEAVAPETKRVSLAAVAQQLRDSTLQELDLREEARRLRSFRKFLDASGLAPAVTCPLPVDARSGERVLTMTRLDGDRLVDAAASDDAAAAVATVVRAWALSVVSHDFFHADLHGGNVLLLRNGTVGLIDFGIVGTLPPAVYGAVVRMSSAFSASPRDYRALATALKDMGIVDARDGFDADAFAADLRRALERSEAGDAAGVATDIIGVSERNNLVLPQEFGLLTKQVVYLNRYVSTLAPELDVFSDSLLAEGVDTRAFIGAGRDAPAADAGGADAVGFDARAPASAEGGGEGFASGAHAGAAVVASRPVQTQAVRTTTKNDVQSLLQANRARVDSLASIAPAMSELDRLRFVLAFGAEAESNLKETVAWRNGAGRAIVASAASAVAQATAQGGWDNEPVRAAAPHAAIINQFITPKNIVTLSTDGGDLVYVIRASLIADREMMSKVSVEQLVEFLLYVKEVHMLIANARSERSGRLCKVVFANDITGVRSAPDGRFSQALTASSQQYEKLYPALAGKTMILNLPFILQSFVGLFKPLFPKSVQDRLEFARAPFLASLDELTPLTTDPTARAKFVAEVDGLLR